MGKGGAPTTTQTVQNQNVAYTPTGLQGFQDIYGKASQVASQPYQPYTGQLVQGLTPTQTGAISNISNIASQPLTSGQIQQYMNPYQNDVINATMGNINETNRQQMADTTGKLTQSAGGVGASRIALGQGELARQQALASNQTLAGLNQQNYAQAVGTAQQQQGFGLGAAQAQLGAGGLEQQTGQAGLTAQYQQYLQQLAFPYQQAQFLAGIGLPALGAMGGQQYQTGQANQTMTPPGMSWLQGLAGAGALGYGAFQGYNNQQQQARRGGRIHHYDDGGGVDDDKSPDLSSDEYRQRPDDALERTDPALAPVLSDKGYIPTTGKELATPGNQIKPMAPMQTQQSGAGGGSTTSGLADLGKLAGTVIGMFLNRGGGVPGYDDGGSVPQQGMGMPGANAYPTPSMLGRPITQGALPQQAQMSSPNVFYGRPLPSMLPPSPVTGQQAGQNMYEMARQALQQQQLGQALGSLRQHASGEGDDVSVSSREYARGGQAVYPEHDAYSAMHGAWEKDRNQIDQGGDAIDRALRQQNEGVPIRPGTPTMDPQGMGRDVRQMADGGDVDDLPMDLDAPVNQINDRFPYDIPPAQQETPAGSVDRRFPFEWGEKGPTDIDRTPLAPLGAYPPVDVNRTLKGSRPDARIIPAPTPDQTAAAQDAIRAGVTKPPPTDVSDTRRQPDAYPRPPGSAFDPATARESDIMDLNNYKSQVAQRPTVRGLMNNGDFWMRAGLNILAANPSKGPIGAIASGAAGTVGQYDQWSKDDLSSKQKAQELAGKLMEHAQKYTRLTAHEKSQLNIEQQRLDQGSWQALPYEGGVAYLNRKTKEVVDVNGNPVDPRTIFSRARGAQSHEMSDKDLLSTSPGSTLADLPRLRQEYQQGLHPQQGPPAGTKAEPDPGQGHRQKGHWYIGPSGQPQQWLGE